MSNTYFDTLVNLKNLEQLELSGHVSNESLAVLSSLPLLKELKLDLYDLNNLGMKKL